MTVCLRGKLFLLSQISVREVPRIPVDYLD